MDQSKIDIIRQRTKTWKLFPNLSTLGIYDFFSQTVVAESIDFNAFNKAMRILKTKNEKFDCLGYHDINKVFSVIIHELTHWLDHTSTVWGQQNLALLFNAFNSRENNNPYDFWRITEVFATIKRLFLSDYYSTVELTPELAYDNKPWIFQNSIGLEYGYDGRLREDRPILFARFTSHDGTNICRIPLSTAALTENIATYDELVVATYFLNRINDSDQRIIESKEFERSLMSRVYNTELAMYFAYTHCIAQILGLKDVGEACKVSSALSTLCLNLPRSIFKSIITPTKLSGFNGRFEYLKQNQNLSFAYLVIAENGCNDYKGDIGEWLEKSLHKSGLPGLRELEMLALKEIETIEDNCIGGSLSYRLKELLSVGRRNFEKRGIFGERFNPVSLLKNECELEFPPVLLGDLSYVQVGQLPLEQTFSNHEDWWETSVRIENKLKEFLNACIL